MTFQWDARKSASNRRKHGVTFEDAVTVFLDPLALTFPDPDHSQNEDREITIGFTLKRQLVIVAHSSRGRAIRVISARLATRSERQQYEEDDL